MEMGKGESPVWDKGVPALGEAYQLYQALQSTIIEMDSKIEEVIKSHEAEFLLAYRTHIQKIKQELAEIKQRGEEQEKKIMSNERSVMLEKQIILFREEALRLYNKLEESSEENDLLRAKQRELQKANELLDKENRSLAKQLKVLEAEKSILQVQFEALQKKCQSLQQLQEHHTLPPHDQLQQPNNYHLAQNSKLFKTPKHRNSFNLPNSLKSRKVSLGAESRPQGDFARKQSQDCGNFRGAGEDQQLKRWFVQCLQTVRREVGQRKVGGYKGDELSRVGSWDEFRMIDRLRLLEMFMQNEKMLVWMYQKIFPSRINQIQAYLATTSADPPQKVKSMSIKIAEIPTFDLLQKEGTDHPEHAVFPKLEKPGSKLGKGGQSRVWRRGEVVKGKLQLSGKGSDRD